MAEAHNPRETSARVEQLLADLSAQADPRVAERAEELVRLLMELYGTALARVMEIAGSEPAGTSLTDRLADDELVASLLILHGLHPLDTAERVSRALDTVRPYLGSHAGGVEFLGIDGDVVQLRLEGSCDGCPSSTVTIKNAIEHAIGEAAPEITGVTVEGAADPKPAHTGLIPVESLYRDRPAAGGGTPSAYPGAASDGAASDGAADGTWVPLPDVSDLRQDELRVVTVAGSQVVVCRASGNLYVYRDSCPSCGSPMAGGKLSGEVAGCPSCGRGYNVRLAGRSADDRDVHLDPLPLVTRHGETRICVPAAVPS
jgi:Fe-S cluster biogenesis protein NfuA/nitrite reductase/ring-hydroxylating ferredoxin subunit